MFFKHLYFNIYILNYSIFQNKSLLMKSSAGILLYDVLNLAKVPPRLINVPPQRLEVTYKLCVCMHGGRLFQVTNERACNEVGESNHPCLK